MKQTTKITLSVPTEELLYIDQFLPNVPNATRSSFMVQSTLKTISDMQSSLIPFDTFNRGKLLISLTNICNLVNSLENSETKSYLQEEVMIIWQSLN